MKIDECQAYIEDSKPYDGTESGITVKYCSSYQDLKEHLKIIQDIRTCLGDENLPIETQCKEEIYYRGQSNAKWNLETTLKRARILPTKIDGYFSELKRVHKNMSSAIANVPPLPASSSMSEWMELLSFTRHLGFPSPLLDWTTSPEIAIFFAFQRDFANDVALYVLLPKRFQESYTAGHELAVSDVFDAGRYFNEFKTHPRHQQQQSCYIVSYTKIYEDKPCPFRFCEYADTAQNGSIGHLFKYIIPVAQRRIVLRDLDSKGINAGVLYGGDDAQMETLFNKEFLLK